jgi:hypothetical protein
MKQGVGLCEPPLSISGGGTPHRSLAIRGTEVGYLDLFLVCDNKNICRWGGLLRGERRGLERSKMLL